MLYRNVNCSLNELSIAFLFDNFMKNKYFVYIIRIIKNNIFSILCVFVNYNK